MSRRKKPPRPAKPVSPDNTPSPAKLVTRSAVPARLGYGVYKEYLRHDFFYSCAYCTMCETEAQAIRFTIDHYEPRNARPDLVNDYNNLMYSCDECNLRKSDIFPPDAARAQGFRFFRPDEDIHSDHFEKSGLLLGPKSNAGDYSIKALDLNRLSLRRLREIRERLTRCDQHVVAGVLGLRDFPIDQLPRSLRGTVVIARRRAELTAGKMADGIDTLLRLRARSPLVDPDPDKEERTKKRLLEMKQLEGLFPGKWRAPRTRQQRKGDRKFAGRKSRRRGP
jgi:5-methylcytosine-specific restriction endonuclease McrA